MSHHGDSFVACSNHRTTSSATLSISLENATYCEDIAGRLKKNQNPTGTMAKDYDYSGPSSGKKRQVKPKEEDDRAIAATLQNKFDEDLATDAQQLNISNEDESLPHDRGTGKGKARESGSTKAPSTLANGQRSDNPYPKPVAKAIRNLQEWTKEMLQTTCRKCERSLMKNFDIDDFFDKGMAMRGSKQVFYVSSITCAKSSCGADTCIGCGRKPVVGKYTADVKGLKLDWCCRFGQEFALWVVLCKYDEEELKVQSQSAQNVAANAPKNNTASKGTGYGSGYRNLGFAPLSPCAVNFRQVGDKTDDMTENLLALALEILPKEQKKADPALCAMIQLSLLQDKAGSLLRNDSIRNVTPRGRLYFAVFAWVERLGRHVNMSYLACDERYPKKRSAGLQTLSMGDRSDNSNNSSAADHSLILCSLEEGMDPSLVDCMAKLATQSRNMISAAQGVSSNEFETRAGKDVLSIAKRVRGIHKSLAPNSHDYQRRSEKVSKADSWRMFYEQNCVEFVADMIPYMRNDMAQLANIGNYSKPDRVRRIATEVAEMSTGLPPNVFVKTDEARPDCIKALIVGPLGTPYEGGLFEFDILCGPQYPDQPPNVQFRTTGGGVAHFNPNLYTNGKVCLSLLGTWYGGSAEETWIAGKSTISSVLVSIQAMILCDHPIENEPAFHGRANSLQSRILNWKVQALTIRYALLDWLRVPDMRNGLWQEVVEEYFAANSDTVLATASRWADQNQGIKKFAPPGPGESLFSDISPGIFGATTALFGGFRTDLLSELQHALSRGKGKRKA